MASSSADEVFTGLKRDLEQQIRDGAYDPQLDAFMENEVVPAWKNNSPVDTGQYRDSVKVTQRAHGGRGQVGATDDIANLIEYGSINNHEYAPRAKTEAQFNNPTTTSSQGGGGFTEADVL